MLPRVTHRTAKMHGRLSSRYRAIVEAAFLVVLCRQAVAVGDSTALRWTEPAAEGSAALEAHEMRAGRRPAVNADQMTADDGEPDAMPHATLVMVADAGHDALVAAAQCTWMRLLDPQHVVHVSDYDLAATGGMRVRRRKGRRE